MIGIVSYLPNDLKLRNIRKKAHLVQIKKLASLFPKEKITIVAQNYKDNEYIKYSKIEYHKFKEKLGPSGARNVIFKLFHESGEDILFLLDDDISWYNYYDIDILLKDYYYNSNKYDIDFIVPLKPSMMPFKKTIYESDYKNYYLSKKVNIQASLCCAMIKNKIKLIQKDYDPSNKDALFEDQLMLEEMITSGLKGYKIFNWILKDNGSNCCTIIETTDKDKSNKWHGSIAKNINNYIMSKYNVDIKQYNKIYNKAHDELLIPRLRKYNIDQNLIPRNK